MRLLILAIFSLLVAGPVGAQPLPSTGVQVLIDRLEMANAAQSVGTGKDGLALKTPPLMLIGPAEVSSKADKIEAPAAAGWLYYSLSVCGAAIIGGNQYIFIITTSGMAAATSSTYAMGVVAANCASGRTFAVYVEADGSTVSAIGSFAR